MATIETRPRQDGSKAYRLKWRFGGKRDGAPQSVTYHDHDDAKRMRGAVEALGHLVYADDPRVVTFELVTGQRPVSYTAPTFGEVGNQYISSRTGASLRTRMLYRRTLNSDKAGLAELVKRPIEAIDDDELRRVLNAIGDRGYYAKNAYDLLRSICKFALNKGLLPNGNPALYVDPPKRRGRTQNFLSNNEAALMLAKCRMDVVSPLIGAALADLTDVILGTGLRISEALGLIVADVHVEDVNNAWIDVTAQLSRPRGDIGDELCRVPVKTQTSERRVVLDVDTARTLARLIKGKRPDAIVFPDPVNGGWWVQHRVNQAWARARKLAQADGLTKSPRLHDLRHTHAAWLLTDGVSLLAVSRRLGHESIAITADIYGHLLPEGDDAIRAAIGNRRKALAAVDGGKTNTPRRRTRKAAASTRPVRRVAGTRAA